MSLSTVTKLPTKIGLLVASGTIAAVLGCTEAKSSGSSAGTAPTVARAGDDLPRRLDAVIDAAVSEGRIVGAVVLVAKNGTLVYHRAAGFADREAGRPIQEDTIFRLASGTKPIVSTTALALIERGALGLDDPVTRWLPSFRPSLTDGRTPVITVRQLLTHTAGLDYACNQPPGGPYLREHVSDGLDEPELSLEENLERIARAPLIAEPGSMWRYSLATDVLGAVIAKAGGAPLPDVVRRLVTDPLGIRVSFSAPDPTRLATPYTEGTPRATRMTDPQLVPHGAGTLVVSPARAFAPRAYPSGGGGMVGTAADYLTFLETLRTGGGKILSPASVSNMTSNQIGPLEIAQGAQSGGSFGFGFGFAVLEKPDSTMPSARGTFQWDGIFGNHFWVDPGAKLTVVVLTNTAIAGMAGPFPDAIRSAIYGRSTP